MWRHGLRRRRWPGAEVRIAASVAALVTLAGCKDIKVRAHRERTRLAQEAARETPSLPAPPPPTGPVGVPSGRYRLIELAVTVRAAGPTGLPWDLGAGAAPDVRAIVKVDGLDVAVCDGPANQLAAICPLAAEVELAAGSRIWIAVVDRDDLGTEAIGSASLVELGRVGRVDAPMALAVSGAVVEAQLAMVAVRAPPSPWDGHRRRTLALGLGALAAAAVIFALRRHLIAPGLPVAWIPTWTCSTCGHANPTSAAACRACPGAR